MNNNGLKLSWGLFTNRWYRIDKQLKDFWIYLKRIKFVIRHSYPDFAQWETFYWFMHSMKPILYNYRNYRGGSPVSNVDDYKEYEKEYDDALDRMLTLIDDMDENSSKYKGMEFSTEQYEQMNAAKDEFFRLFSKYFYYFWD